MSVFVQRITVIQSDFPSNGRTDLWGKAIGIIPNTDLYSGLMSVVNLKRKKNLRKYVNV